VYADYALQCESGAINDQLPENGGLILGERTLEESSNG
jgi:hypothetical protein